MSNVCGILDKWDLLIYFIGEFRVKLWSALLPPHITSSEKKMLMFIFKKQSNVDV